MAAVMMPSPFASRLSPLAPRGSWLLACWLGRKTAPPGHEAAFMSPDWTSRRPMPRHHDLATAVACGGLFRDVPAVVPAAGVGWPSPAGQGGGRTQSFRGTRRAAATRRRRPEPKLRKKAGHKARLFGHRA